jgi:cytochrome c oxidase subunit 1
VVHVDLSVAIWFMAFAAVIWSALGRAGLAWLGWAGFALAALGTAVMTVSPFLPGAEPVLNNYIPVLQQPFFLPRCGSAVPALRWPCCAPCSPPGRARRRRPLQTGAFLGAVAAFLALGAFVWSWASWCRRRSRTRSTSRCCSGAADTPCNSSMRC